MCKFRELICLAVFSASLAVAVSLSEQETFKISRFLQYESDTKNSYITASAGMAAIIAGQNSETLAKCIDQWIARNRTNDYQTVINTMQNYPDYHPQAVILAILQKDCGSFKFGQ